MSGPIERRVFVVGVPRSGTTLVQSLLAAHPGLTSFTESHLFAGHFRTLPGPLPAILVRDPRDRVEEFLVENGIDPQRAAEMTRALRRILLIRRLPPLATRAVGRELVALLDRLALAAGTSGWVEKTPRHLHHLGLLERLTRERPAHFVHVVRDGLETVASLRRASRDWERSYDLAACVARWNSDLALSLGRAGRPRDHFVFYEELTERPEATLETLFTELGIEWLPSVLERFGAAAEGLVTHRETWKAGVSSGRLERSATSRHALSPEERRWVEGELRHDLYRRLQEKSSLDTLAGR